MASVRIQPLDLSFRTAYAQAKELALAQKEVSLATAGSIQAEKRREGRFVYRYRYDAAGKRVAEYLGPEGAGDTAARLGRALAEIRDAEILAGYSRDLRKVGFYSADNSTVVTVASLFNAGIFGKGGVLVGTHAFGALLNEIGVAAAIPLTEDVDIARSQPIQIAALPRGGFVSLLKQTGLPFLEVPQLKRGAPPTSFKVRGRKLTVDLLVPAKGVPYRAVPVRELGAHASGLPYFEYLLESPAPSMLLGRDRIVPVVVPHAGRFCVHKLALYALRGGVGNPKREKDVLQAALLAAALSQGQEFLLDEAIKAADRTLRAKASPGVKRALDLLGDEHPEAARRIEALA
jgi:YD repeat-containing protein